MIKLVIASILAGASFLGVIFFANPNSAGKMGVVVLCISFIISMVCLALLIWQLKILKKS